MAQHKVGLVLEGGGMKGLFTAGVLDFFLEKNLEFGEIIGVSAGAIHAVGFLSKQKRRSLDITLRFVNDKRYCSLSSLRKTGDLFNAKFAYYEIPEKYFPFDHDTFMQSKTRVFAVATNIDTAEAEYLQIKDLRTDDIEALRASASIPMLSNDVEYRGEKYLDGGVSDSIPLKQLEADGHPKNIVVMTKSANYRKKPSKTHLAMKKRYRNCPELIERVKNRHTEYNACLDYLNKQEKSGKIFVIRPSNDDTKRIEKDTAKLQKLYDEGYNTAKKLYPKLKQFLEQ